MREIRNVALCAGAGGLERGIARVFPGLRTVAICEGEAYVAALLASKMEAGEMDSAPIWNDVRSFDGKPWRGVVHSISAGFPCQPFSAAGLQKGTEDPRHLWPDVARIIGEIRPTFVFLENVAAIVDLAASIVGADLAQMGYDSAWCIVRASNTGAPHRRRRWFCLAVRRDDADPDDSDQPAFSINDCPGREDHLPNPDGDSCEEGESRRRPGSLPRPSGSVQEEDRGLHRNEPRGGGETLVHTHSPGGPRHPLGFEEDEIEWQEAQRLLNAASLVGRGFDPWWSAEPGLGRMADGVADWMDRLRALGNGVVPAQAALAFSICSEALVLD